MDPAPTPAVERVREICYLEELVGCTACRCDCLTVCDEVDMPCSCTVESSANKGTL